MRKYFVLMSLLFICCNTKRESCIVTADRLLKDYSDKVFVTDKNAENIVEINDKGLDSTKGGVYFFYPDGNLRKM